LHDLHNLISINLTVLAIINFLYAIDIILKLIYISDN